MIISDLNQMEARVDVGEMDVVGIKPGQKARLEVDAFKDRKFSGTVTDVASSSKDSNQTGTIPAQQPVAGSHQVPGAHPAQRQGSLPPRHVRQRRH